MQMTVITPGLLQFIGYRQQQKLAANPFRNRLSRDSRWSGHFGQILAQAQGSLCILACKGSEPICGRDLPCNNVGLALALNGNGANDSLWVNCGNYFDPAILALTSPRQP